MCNAHTATSRRQKPGFPLPIAQPTDRTSLKEATAAHSVYLDHLSSLPFHLWGSADSREQHTGLEYLQKQA